MRLAEHQKEELESQIIGQQELTESAEKEANHYCAALEKLQSKFDSRDALLVQHFLTF